MLPPALSTSVCERLVRYLALLQEGCGTTITSAELAVALSVDSSLVRKDLAAVGLRGAPHKGFASAAVLVRLKDFLGVDRKWKAVIVGAGRLGTALACHRAFAGLGLRVTGIFDRDPAKIGLMAGDHRVRPVDQLEAHIRAKRVPLAILTVPGEAAQPLAERLAEAGIRAIWNFSPTPLVLPAAIFVRHEQLAVGLGTVICGLRQREYPAARVARPLPAAIPAQRPAGPKPRGRLA